MESYFAKNLEWLMRDNGTTPTELAEAVGVTTQSINSYKKEGFKPRENTLKKIATYFGHTPEQLVNVDMTAHNTPLSFYESEQVYFKPVEVNLGDDIRLIKARTGVILSALSELLSEKSKRLAASELSDLENLVNIQLKKDRKEQQGA
jgi:transcriptional regulator with XRE-family HTH domain